MGTHLQLPKSSTNYAKRLVTCSVNQQHLKRKKTAPMDSLFQEDLNKIKTDTKNFSSARESTDDLFKNSDKKNAEISNELKALKREVNKRFGEEKGVGKRRNELFDFFK